MAGELNRQYGVGPVLAEVWAKGREIVPMLDGLDEVDGPRRAACVKAINDYRAAHPETASPA